jgi:hypothetical protein
MFAVFAADSGPVIGFADGTPIFTEKEGDAWTLST